MDLQLDPNVMWGMVAYTDGGAKPNPGHIGAGMHAYFYQVPATPTVEVSDAALNAAARHLATVCPDYGIKLRSMSKADAIKLLTEKAYFIEREKVKPNKFTDGDATKYAVTTTTGYVYSSKDGVISTEFDKSSVPVKAELIVSRAESTSNHHSNNYAEMKALLNALDLAISQNIKRLHVISDSNYTLKGVNQWVPGWMRNGWQTQNGSPVANRELWEAIWKSFTEYQNIGVFSSSWIKGHKGHPGNDQADHTATIGCIKSTYGIDDPGIHIHKAKDYWEPKRDRHPLLSLRRMYFNRVADRNTPGHYMLADPGKDDALVGKPQPEVVYAVVRMKEPVPNIQAVLAAQGRYGQDFNSTMMIKLEDIYSNYPYRLLEDHGEYAMKKAKVGTNVVFPDERQASIERNPIGITMRAVDSLNNLEAILDNYLELQKDPTSDNHRDIQVHPLTEDVYDLVEKKKPGKGVVIERVLKKDFTMGLKAYDFKKKVKIGDKEREFKFHLKLGSDIPDRNTLKKLEDYETEVHLITWRESDCALRFATVIICNDGMAIWSNYYADTLVFKPD